MKVLRLVLILVLATVIQPAVYSAGRECAGETLNTDTLTVSFMTCEPGSEIYELYGHSAIRIRTASGADWVFNYGMFNFNTPNFVARFVLGKTDYYMSAYTYSDFISEYEYRGSAVIEQVLNLTEEEKYKLWHSLVKTAQLANWTYRYNFLYDNCTTRARDQIENCVDGSIAYPTDTGTESYRQIIHKYTKGYEWSEFGQDILLGSGADVPISERQKMFAPMYMEKYNSKAYIIDKNGSKRPLVIKTEVHHPIRQKIMAKGFPIPPICVFGTLLAVTLVLCVAEIRKRKIYWGLDFLQMLAAGLAGCLITTLFLFSEHPTVNTNWLITVFNPIPLLYIPIRVIKVRRRRFDMYAPVATVVIVAFIIVSAFISQTFNASIYCFTLSLCFQSATCTYIQYKTKWKRNI